jgi:hypothetical protein
MRRRLAIFAGHHVGPGNCTLTNGFVNFTNGLSTTPPNGNEKAVVYGQLSCTTANVLPSVSSLTGVYKRNHHVQEGTEPKSSTGMCELHGRRAG